MRDTPAAVTTRALCATALLASALLAGAHAQTAAAPKSRTAPAELKPETVTVEPLPPAPATRLFVSDPALGHLIDGRLNVFDGDSGRFLGLISTGFAGHATLTPDRSTILVATTHHSRTTRGERTDVLEFHDAATLAFRGEVVIPPKHAQALPYTGMLRVTPDGRWALVQNATPAVSVTVVDLRAKKVTAEIATPGCWSISVTPSRSDRFATLCGDGTAMVFRLDDAGALAGTVQSAKFFDPDDDPVFVHVANRGDTHYVLSFQGRVHELDFSGDAVRLREPWSLVTGQDKRGGWRPGGYQLSAIHEASGRLFVGMHRQGAEGSHKNPAAEIRVYDLEARKRVRRVAGRNAIAMTVNQAESPRLFAIDGVKGEVAVLHVERMVWLRSPITGIGETPAKLETFR